MAEEKITIVDLRKAIAKQTNTEEAQVGVFLNQMIAAIKEGLKRDKQVRISGLGTFKLLWVEPRKSVNISTGEPIIIEGYQKLSFTPEPSVKERINEPYADLVSVELDAEGNRLPNQPVQKADPMQKFDEQAMEIKDLLADLGAATEAPEAPEAPNPQSQLSSNHSLDGSPSFGAREEAAGEPASEIPEIPEVPATPEEPAAEEPAEEEPAAEEESELDKTIAAAAAVVAAVKEIPKEPIDEEEEEAPNPHPLSPTGAREVIAEEPESPEKPEEHAAPAEEAAKEEPAAAEPAEEPVKKDKQKKPFRWWLVVLITLIVLFGLIALGVLFLESKVEAWADKLNGKTPTAQVVEEPAPFVPAADTFAMQDDSTVAEEPAAETPAATSTDFYKERTYTEFIGLETVKEGSRLTWIARKYYGSKDLWVFIYEANKEKIKNPGNVVVGTQLRIPALPEEIIKQEAPKAQKLVKDLQDTYLN